MAGYRIIRKKLRWLPPLRPFHWKKRDKTMHRVDIF